jgi:hypothetical protein
MRGVTPFALSLSKPVLSLSKRGSPHLHMGFDKPVLSVSKGSARTDF